MCVTRLGTFLWLLSYNCKNVKPVCCLNSSLKIGLFVKCDAFCAFFQVLFFYFNWWSRSTHEIYQQLPFLTMPSRQLNHAMFEELMYMKTITYQKIWVTQSVLISQRRFHPSLSRTRATLGSLMSKYLSEILLRSVLENEPLDTLHYNFNYSSLKMGKVDWII